MSDILKYIQIQNQDGSYGAQIPLSVDSINVSMTNGDNLENILNQKASISDVENLRSAVGSPLIASTVSSMTNINKIYVYTGLESGYINGNWYYWDGSAWTSGGVYNAIAINIDSVPTQGSNNAVKSGGVYSEIEKIKSNIGKEDYTSLFELGGINITVNGWSYSASTIRVRTKEGTTLHIKAGVTIGLSDYTDARFYVGWLTNGTYGTTGEWKRSDYTTTVEGDYVILISTYSSTEQSSSDALASLFFRSDDNLYGRTDDLADEIDSVNSALDGLQAEIPVVDPIPTQGSNNAVSSGGVYGEIEKIKINIGEQDYTSLFELGGMSITASGWSYSASTTRVRTKEGTTIHFKAGVTIGLTDYSDTRFYVGWHTDDGYDFNNGWKRSDFVTPVEGDYVILISTYSNTEQESVNTLAALFFRTDDTVYKNISGLVSRIDTTDANLETTNDNLDATNNKISRQDYCSLLELGGINFSESGWTYTNTSQRVRTRNGITLHIKAGVTVGLTDYTDARFCLGWKKSDGTYENIAMRRSDFVTTAEGDYVLLIANYTGASEDSINRLGSRFFVSSDTVFGAVADLNYADVARWSQVNTCVRSVNHRGFVNAPENSLVSYKMARKYGFTHAECDITWTSDNVCVLHHDETINRTGRNADGTAISETININDITYAEALTYDFGIYKNPVYAGLKIPKLEEFLVLCRNIGIKPYIEIKPYNITQAKIESLVDMVRRYGMEENSEYISSSPEALTFLKNYNPKASIGYVVGAINATLIATANSLKTGTNKVFMVSSARTAEAVDLCYNNNLPLIVWTINDANELCTLDPYVSGVLSDMIVMGKCLYDYAIN